MGWAHRFSAIRPPGDGHPAWRSARGAGVHASLVRTSRRSWRREMLAEDPRQQGLPFDRVDRCPTPAISARRPSVGGLATECESRLGPIRDHVGNSTRYDLARRSATWRQAKRGLKRGLRGRQRTVILMLDETIITETPPLSSCYGPKGQQVRVPITGNRAKRVVHGALNIRTGALLLLISDVWDQATHQYFLTMIPRTLARLAHCVVRSPWLLPTPLRRARRWPRRYNPGTPLPPCRDANLERDRSYSGGISKRGASPIEPPYRSTRPPKPRVNTCLI